MCVYFHKNCNKISIFKFLAYRVYEGYDKAVEDETSHTTINQLRRMWYKENSKCM